MDVFENEAFLVVTDIVIVTILILYRQICMLIPLCLLCAIHFHTVDMLLCTLFISQSWKDDRKCTRNCCPGAKHEISFLLDQTYNGDW